MTSDLELLEQYSREHRQEAFAALLDRHLKLVYCAALRQVRSPELAEEVAQSVFSDLARGAGKLKPQTILPAWLYEVTRRTAIDVIRRESRRQTREQIAFAMSQTLAQSAEWTNVEPLLDEAMESLEPADRAAILLRFFQDQSLREVGQALGTSEDAAQKRVSRALEQLREFFSKQGKSVGAGGLAAILATHSAQSAPAGLKAAILSGTVSTITKTILMTTLQKTLVGGALAITVGAGFYEHQRATALADKLTALQSRPAPVAVPAYADESRQALANLRAENEKLRRDAADVARLRGEIARLRDNAAAPQNDATSTEIKSWLGRLNSLRERFRETPGAAIPEFQYLTERDWLKAAKNDLNTSNDFRAAMSDVRDYSEGQFVSQALQPALKAFEKANKGQFPSNIAQLKPYFDPPVDDAILQRWEVAPKSTVPSMGVGNMVLTQVSAIDPQHDNRYAIGLYGSGCTGPQDWSSDSADAEIILRPALKAYMLANNGVMPDSPAELAPYLTTPQQHTALDKIIKQQPPK